MDLIVYCVSQGALQSELMIMLISGLVQTGCSWIHSTHFHRKRLATKRSVDNICLHSLTVASDLIVPFKKYSRYTPCFELMSYFVHGITHVTLKLNHVRKPIIVWLVCAYLFFFHLWLVSSLMTDAFIDVRKTEKPTISSDHRTNFIPPTASNGTLFPSCFSRGVGLLEVGGNS